MTRTVFIAIVLLLASTVAPLWAADFDHKAHVEEYVDAGCGACHVDGADSIVPATSVCIECHDAEMIEAVALPETNTHGPVWSLNHGDQAKGVSANCSSCHAQEYCLDCHKAGFSHEQGSFSNNMINVHRSDFSVSHPIAARADQQQCFRCHEAGSCEDCHDTFAPNDLAVVSHRRGFSNGTLDGAHAFFDDTQCSTCHEDPDTGELSVIPSSTGWSAYHAREARKNLMTCQTCHPEGDICLRCHSAKSGLGVNPHPKDWGDIKNNLRDASNGRTCRKCH